MNRTFLALALLVALPLATRAGTHPLTGSWTASVDEKRADRLDFSMRTNRHENNGTRFLIDDFVGLSRHDRLRGLVPERRGRGHVHVRRERGVPEDPRATRRRAGRET
jgi:hypothetical protein